MSRGQGRPAATINDLRQHWYYSNTDDIARKYCFDRRQYIRHNKYYNICTNGQISARTSNGLFWELVMVKSTKRGGQ